ncbi:MAG TPA: type II secretion system F family protein [Solirubrobacteraceae bacterium]|jgi:type IV pilus assembly protein PilC|nr:type II secretion system F family protein [Solirubrobacteraceae bacterium]
MATYAFKAVDLSGIPSQGEIQGADKPTVTAMLKEQGLKVMALEEKKSGLQMELRLGPKRVKAAELTVMSRQLATMISSGMTLLRAFYVLEEQVENQLLRETISGVREDIEAGLAFSDALERHPKVFTPLYVAMVRAGEAGGVLEESLDRISDQLEKDDSLRRQVKSAMAYPTVVFSFAMLVLIGMIAFIVPVFIGVFKDFGGELPAITKFTVALSNAVTGQWYILIAGFVGSVVAFRKWKSSSWGRPQWDQFRLRIPFKIGDTVQKIALARWSRTFSALYGAGVPIMQAIEVTGQTAGNAVVDRAMAAVIESVKSGGSIAEPLKSAPIFPPMVAQMIAIGEETGNLDTMLSKVADFYEDEVAAAIKALTSILEPVMIVLVGGIVGFIVVAMYMPMFKVYDSIK